MVTKNKFRSFLLAILCLSINSVAWSAPITFNSALPVAKDELIFRELFIIRQSGRDPSTADRDRSAWSAVSVLGYGLTSKLAVFGVLPYVNRDVDILINGQRRNRSSDGLGDIRVLGRYTVFQQDWPGRTLRLAPFAGFKAPTGNHDVRDSLGKLPPDIQPGSGSWDVFGGMVVSYQTLNFQVDSQISYQSNSTANGIELGDFLRVDSSWQYRLWPRILSSELSGFLYGVLESNLIVRKKNRINAQTDNNSGGNQWFLTPGLQYVTRRWVIETAVQIPVIQQLNGKALENDFILQTGFRFNF